jgi:hypothetical protein
MPVKPQQYSGMEAVLPSPSVFKALQVAAAPAPTCRLATVESCPSFPLDSSVSFDSADQCRAPLLSQNAAMPGGHGRDCGITRNFSILAATRTFTARVRSLRHITGSPSSRRLPLLATCPPRPSLRTSPCSPPSSPPPSPPPSSPQRQFTSSRTASLSADIASAQLLMEVTPWKRPRVAYQRQDSRSRLGT